MSRAETSDLAPGLSVVIPVWNDTEGLARLLPALLALDSVRRIIVADDGSDTAASPEANEALRDFDGEPRILWLRSEDQQGAGHARNTGMARVETTHLLFLDSDDLVLEGFAALLERILRQPHEDVDFYMFRHVDSRQRARGHLGPLDTDQTHWDRAGIRAGMQRLSAAQAAQLCRVSAYPWNKVYRTDFLRDHAICCTEIPVHNDIELHWRSFFHARAIQAAPVLAIEHFVNEAGQRLTNRKGEDRLRVFEALEPLRRDMEANSDIALMYADALLEFHLALFHWITAMLDPLQAADMTQRAQRFIRASLTPGLFSLIALRDPRLATRVNDFLERGVL